MSFAENLARIRKEKGLSQTELADLVGVTRGTICSYESEKRTHVSASIVFAIADALDVNPRMLVEKRSTANIVKAIRCKNCKYWKQEVSLSEHWICIHHSSAENWFHSKPDFFCADGIAKAPEGGSEKWAY